MRTLAWPVGVVCAVLLVGCLGGDSDPGDEAGRVDSSHGPFGPAVVYEPLHRPVPEVPFPNDAMLRPSDHVADETEWNLSPEAPTAAERRVRTMMQGLDGFGPFAPITVSFSGPIDLETVTDDTVLLVNIEPGHEREGELVPLDLGKGYFPTARTHAYWPHDAKGQEPDLIYPSGNSYDLDGDGKAERVTHYEVMTHTLILRPVVPMAQGARHAVLLMEGITGPVGGVDAGSAAARGPIRSPFPFKAHAAQSSLIGRALELTERSKGDLAFGWTFTTGHLARPLVRIREGLYGRGALARLADAFPPGIAEFRDPDVPHDTTCDDCEADPTDNRYIVQAELLTPLLSIIGNVDERFALALTQVDYLVFGSFDTPGLRTGDYGTFGVDTRTGEGEVGTEKVPFMITVPKAVPGRHEPPFPVVFYFHGTSTSRLEALGIADAMARQGIALVAFDEVGHGPVIPDIGLLLEQQGLDAGLLALLIPVLVDILAPQRAEEFEQMTTDEALDAIFDIGLFGEFAVVGRTEDDNGDGALESSESFFYADPFRLCASFWQSVVDFLQIVRTVRAFSPDAVPAALDPATASEEALLASMHAGDFNTDGVLDIGGPNVHFGVAGTSLGGFHAVIAGAVEPEVTTATPIVAGGGTLDIILRSRMDDIIGKIVLESMGPMVVGCPDREGGVWLSFNDDTDNCKDELLARQSFAHLPHVAIGSVVTVTNTANGEQATAIVNRAGGFSVGVESDRWDPLSVRVERIGGQPVEVPVLTPYEGLGFERNSPDFRRFLGLAQHALDRCDPVGFARHLFIEPLEGHPPTHVLFDNAVGDRTVPIASGVSLARAAGVLGVGRETWEPVMQTLISTGFMNGANYDVDDMLNDNPADAPGIGPLPVVDSGGGESAIRFADVDGFHEWIASVNQGAPLDHAVLSQSRIALFHLSEGRKVIDDLCIARLDCPLLDDPTPAFDWPR